VGCGSGILLEDIARLFSDHGELYGTDISEQALKIASTRLPGVTFFQSDLNVKILAGHGLFDLVISRNT